MTPQERQLIDELFDRLARLEGTPRDGEAERAIAEGLSRAPHAIYPLVQTVLVQDEALKAAEDHIRALSGETGTPGQPRGFLDTMRSALLGGAETPRRGSVPEVRPSVWGAGTQAQQQPPQQPMPDYGNRGGGGSFLGTAAAAAAGAIGGSLLLNSLRGDQAHARQSAFDDPGKDTAWGSARDSDLAREAGLNDVGAGGGGQGWFDRPQHFADGLDVDNETGGDGGSDFDGDGGGDGGGGGGD